MYGRHADVLVNNAGVPGGGEIQDLSYERIRDVVEVNLLGTLYGMRAFLPEMLRTGQGHVVNVASLAGRFATPGTGLYSADQARGGRGERVRELRRRGPRRCT